MMAGDGRGRLTVVSHPAVVDANQAPYLELERFGWDVTIITPARWRSEWGQLQPTRLEGLRGALRPLPVRLSGSIPLHHYSGLALRQALCAARPDVVYVEEEPYSWAAYQVGRLARAMRVPFVFYSAQNIERHYPWPFAARERWVLAHAAAALPITAEVSEVLRRKGCTCAIQEVPLWVRPQAVSEDQRAAIRARAGGADRFVVGFAGRLVAQKGLDILLAACERAQLADLALLVAGIGPLEEVLRARGATWAESRPGAMPRMCLLGRVPHGAMAPVFATMDALVLPSVETARSREQFGRVLVEAALHGCALIGTDVGWIPRLLQDLGGVCVPQGDPAALAEALIRVRAEIRSGTGAALAATRRRRAERYTVARVASQFDAVFCAAVEAGHGEGNPLWAPLGVAAGGGFDRGT